MKAGFNIEDVLFAFDKQLACRHISNANEITNHMSNAVDGDAYALGAAHLFTFPEAVRNDTAAFQSAQMEKILEAFDGGETDRDSILGGGEKLVQSYKNTVRQMVAHAVNYDDRHNQATDCVLLVYSGIPSVISPDDLDKYPFGKCGKQALPPQKLGGAIYLSEEEKEQCGNSAEAVKEKLTEKTLSFIHRMREREHQRTEPYVGI